MNDGFQVSFLPWVELKKTINLGPVIFWPYYLEADRRISDRKIKTHLDKYFASYVDHHGHPITAITICSHGKVDFRSLTKAECQELINTVDILIFATIAPQAVRAVCANNDSWGPPSADVFELVTQSFRVGSREIAVQAGSCLSAGDEIGKITFPKPWSIGGMFGSPEEELVKGLDKCFSPQFPKDVTERIFRSLEWFRLAHIEGGQVSVLSKLVMMATSFEILLQFPAREKRKYFVEYAENHIASDEFFRDNRSTDKGKSFNLSLAGCWTWDFYDLRSRIVHGDLVSSNNLIYRNWITHLIVADLFYWNA